MELRLLATRRALRALKDYEQWLEWEDMPLLGEREFARLCRHVEEIGEWWGEHLREFERAEDIDSAEVEGRVS
jgi:hypothetical protein